MLTVILLTISNIFMTFAWYGHLKFKDSPLWIAILASWAIAFLEYCFQVPANRYGHGTFSTTQLKIIQEVITLVVFCGFAVFFMGDTLKWNYLAGFVCIFLAVVFVFGFDRKTEPAETPAASATIAPPDQALGEPATGDSAS